MKPGTVLSKDAVTKVIKDAGFVVASFEGGPPPTVTAYTFRVTGLAPGAHGQAKKALAAAIDSPTLVVVDATGAAAVTLPSEKKTSEAALKDALAKAGYSLEGFAVAQWPAAPAVYEIDVPAMTDAAAATKARAALTGLEKVFAAEVYSESRKAVIRLNEPCSAIEKNSREALAKAGLEVATFRLTTR